MEERFFKFSVLSKFPELIQGVSTRNYGDMRFGKLKNEEVTKNRQQFFQSLGIEMKDVVVPKLTHDVKIINVGQEERGRGAKSLKAAIPQTDGLITSEKGIFLMVTIADCLAVFIYDPVLNIVGILHAGWRGIVGQIVPLAISKFRNLGSEPTHLIVGVSPGICQKHFVVKNDVLKEFKDLYPKATFVRNHDGYVDLKKAVLSDLRNAGVLQDNIEISNDCPSCSAGIYGSFRKEGPGVPASAAVIGMKNE